MEKQKGMALLMVMLLLALMALLATTASAFWQQAFNHTTNLQARNKAKWLLLGAENIAKQRLLKNTQNSQTSQQNGLNTFTTFSLQTEDGPINITIQAAQTCLNINTLDHYFSDESLTTEEDEAATNNQIAKQKPAAKMEIMLQIFNALLTNLKFTPEKTQLLADAILARLNNKGTQATAFTDISELRQLPLLSREEYLRLIPFLCVLPERTPNINLNALDKQHLPLLQALFLNQATASTLQNLLAHRPLTGWQGVNDPHWLNQLENLHLPPVVGKLLLKSNSHYFHIYITTNNEDKTFYLDSLAYMKKQNIKVMQRKIGQKGEN